MHGLPSRAQRQGTVPVPIRVALGAKPRQSVVRKTLAVGLVGAVYALIAGVMSEAYHEFDLVREQFQGRPVGEYKGRKIAQ